MTGVRAVPERYGWALRVLLVAAVLYGAVAIVTLVTQVVQLVAWVQPGARVPVEMGTVLVLPTNGGENHYSGAAFVQDGTALVATHVATTLNAVPLVDRILMGSVPILWTLTALAVTLLLGVAIRRLSAGTAYGSDSSRPVVLAALALAIGSSIAQIVDGATFIGFGGFDWGAPSSMSRAIDRTGGFTFEFAPLLAACGLLVVALVLRRGLALQRDVEGLV